MTANSGRVVLVAAFSHLRVYRPPIACVVPPFSFLISLLMVEAWSRPDEKELGAAGSRPRESVRTSAFSWSRREHHCFSRHSKLLISRKSDLANKRRNGDQ